MPVQRCTLSLPIPLLPLWAVQPVQNLIACTTVHFKFTYTSTPPIGRTACTQSQCLYNGALTFTYTSTSPMGRTACTEPQCPYNGALYLYLYLYTPYGPYSLYPSACTTVHFTLPYTLLPLWAIQPVQSLSVCTTVHFTFTYTSTPPMDRTACTEPHCLFNGAIYLYLYL